MTALSRAEPTPSFADIVRELEQAELRPDAALWAAVGYVADIAPVVIDLIEQAASGSSLREPERNLLFWGIHVLAAERRTELFLPLLNLVSKNSDRDLYRLLDDTATQTLARIVISVFHGPPAPLLDACANIQISGLVRWGLIDALARLTFDGAIDRQTTWDFLDRFEREPLADPEDQAWQGWQNAVCLLGLEDMHERLHAACREDRFLQYDEDLLSGDEQFTLARSLAPGDARLFVEALLVPIDDPVEALKWLDDDAYEDASEGDDDLFDNDPANSTALSTDEITWLASYLASTVRADEPPPSVEQIDGFLCALAMGGDRAQARKAVGDIVNDLQAPEARDLIVRMWNTIVDRLDANYAHRPLLRKSDAPEGQLWAKAFIAGSDATDPPWDANVDDDDIRMFIAPIVKLLLADGEEANGFRMTPEIRADSVAALRSSILGLYVSLRYQRLKTQRILAPQQPVKSIKVGRNEPCPCGSGKKYKRCCGSADKRALH